ncbi:HAD family hydrolase [Candidatus Campbellbacteria bacterium CG10_big_fil_rev_8_21_14_0_10_35_52]|uniref:phosphomannomutase n=1 Tax=Candidatus Campbellbacteria bacterium CG10_big_fil_rev_8_21_14_0_10_35_52 TaxID=1974527 RepID=A0A2M6WW04_9BACT|nr:MAG: HAD family hydrolase [Candidatus Campbellbacteria bacterium CG10_big_fil_rev_8_21_14_0_10_35_52]
MIKNHKKISNLDKNIKLLSIKKIIVFDLDGTLTKSKMNLDKEMANLICRLLEKKIVAVISGGNYPQFKKQFLEFLNCPKDHLKNLFILPTSGGRLYKYEDRMWRLAYKNILTTKEKSRIGDAFKKAFADIDYIPSEIIYGNVIEDRESQITFSALGQKASIAKKEEWNKKQDIRFQLKVALEKYLSDFEVRIGGLTSIDVTKKGIDKAYGIKKIAKLLSASIKEMAYIGDAIFEGGNDFAVVSIGIDTIQVSGITDVKYLIRKLLAKK